MTRRIRHILSLSGGKDSTALAIYLRDRIPDLEYVFCDTEKELPETYEYLDTLEQYLGRPVVRLKHDGRDFDHWLVVYGGYLPSPQMRWCTKHLKIRPFERYVGDDDAVSYVGIRADEDRLGYLSTKPNIRARYPFKEDGIEKQDVLRILRESGLGLPRYYRWRSRSGCYFCFFQQRIEWVGLLENHPRLFQDAMRYEECSDSGERFTWVQSESLEQLCDPARIAEIKEEHAKRMLAEQERRKRNARLVDVLGEDDIDDVFCSVVEGSQLQEPCQFCI